MQPINFFFRAAARYPNETAVIAPDRQLTFLQLDERLETGAVSSRAYHFRY